MEFPTQEDNGRAGSKIYIHATSWPVQFACFSILLEKKLDNL
jgi:hypothetical protein